MGEQESSLTGGSAAAAGCGLPSLRAALLIGAFAASAAATAAQASTTSAKAAFIHDVNTGTIMLSKNPDRPVPPASMSKLMTIYMAFEALRDGRISMGDKLTVSKNAMSYGGSTMFLDTTDSVTVEDVLRGIIVLSGNDASAVLAEALSPDGTELGFARQMTRRAKDMGLKNTNLVNSNGWPAPTHRMSPRDLAMLAERLIQDFPEYYPMFAETQFEFDGRAPANKRNRNPLLFLDVGADGLKTGHTEKAGYGLVASAKQGDRRVVLVVTGLPDARTRSSESRRLTEWSFRQFNEKSAFAAGDEVAMVDVWMGRSPAVAAVVADDVGILLPASARGVDAQIVYEGPIHAPVAEGDQVAELVVRVDGLPDRRVPLYAAADVPVGGLLVRVSAATRILFRRGLSTLRNLL